MSTCHDEISGIRLQARNQFQTQLPEGLQHVPGDPEDPVALLIRQCLEVWI